MGAQVMEEGERLSKKQLAQENRIKELRASADELRCAMARAEAATAAERQKVGIAMSLPHRMLLCMVAWHVVCMLCGVHAPA